MPNAALVLTAPSLNEEHIATVESVLTPSNGKKCEPKFLSPGQACEWPLKKTSTKEATEQLTAARRALGAEMVDVNLVADDNSRRKRLLIADMDSTIIEQECIDEIADLAGCGAEVADITERTMQGELEFDEALRDRVALLKGLDVSVLERVVNDRLTVTPGARTLVFTMAANGAYCALVSGGFTFFTSRIAQTVGFHENRANTLEISGNKLTGRPVLPILGRQAKLDALTTFCQERAIPFKSALAVGDGANDTQMIKAAGLGVAYRAQPVVAAAADANINHSDLTALLYLQGYHQSEFIC